MRCDLAKGVPELKEQWLSNWKVICGYLSIDIEGVSARRRLISWVKENKHMWHDVC